jgi:hypothetical protein
MELNFGGPVWHASSRGADEACSWAMAERALEGVGDAALGEWREAGSPGSGVVHIRRRLSHREATNRGLVVRDIRGTAEEEFRLGVVARELGLRR